MTQHQRVQKEGTPHSTPSPAIDIDALLTNEEENLKLGQISATQPRILDLLGDPGNPLYAEPHSMAEHFYTMMLGTHAIGQLPNQGHCKDSEALTRVYEDEAQQACQKTLRCLDIRVLDSDLIDLTCLQTPTLILPTGHFMQLYYNPEAQGDMPAVLQRQPRLPAAQGGHLTVHHSKGIQGAP